LQEFPIRSKLDPTIYGPPESAITKELLEQELGGISLEKVCSMFCFLLLYLFILQKLTIHTFNQLLFTLTGYRGKESIYY